MRRTLAVSVLALALCAACAHVATPAASAPATVAASPATSEDARLNAWFERKYEEELRFSPIELTMLGRKELYAQLDDMSREGAAKQLAWREAAVAEASFEKLSRGIMNFMNETHFKRLVMILRSAGFVHSDLIGGQNAVILFKRAG